MPARKYIKDKIKEAPAPEEPLKLLYVFLKYNGGCSDTLKAWMGKQHFPKISDTPAHKVPDKFVSLAIHLEYLDIPVI